MNEENEWDQIIDVDVVEGPIEKVTVEEVMTAWREKIEVKESHRTIGG